MQKEEFYSSEEVHCIDCSTTRDESIDIEALQFLLLAEYFAHEPAVLPVECRLARQLEDQYLDIGPDSAVFRLRQEPVVLKIHPKTTLKKLKRYQEEIEDLRIQGPQAIKVDDVEYSVDFVPITHVVQSPYGHKCMFSYSPLIVGPNFYQFTHDYCRQKTDKEDAHFTDFSPPISKMLTKYYKKQTLGKCPKFYLDPHNFVVDFEQHQIHITDLASSIPNFLKEYTKHTQFPSVTV